MKCDCKAVFNSLSKFDRVKLRGAALTKAVVDFIRDDTRDHPARYPFYAAYLFLVAAPLPVPLVSTVTLAATVLWARYSRSEYAARLKDQIKDSFNHAALVCDHRRFLKPDFADQGRLKVQNGALAWNTTKEAARDTWQATKYAFSALNSYIRTI